MKMVKLECASLHKTNAYLRCSKGTAAALHISRPTHDSFTVHTNLFPTLGVRILKRAKLKKLCFYGDQRRTATCENIPKNWSPIKYNL
jgi:hypothetical protein